MTTLDVEPPPSAAGAHSVPPLTLSDGIARLAPGSSLAELWRWPPDVFAFTSLVLADSGAYRCVVDPPTEQLWPPAAHSDASWEGTVRRAGAEWAAWAGADEDAGNERQEPEPLRRLRATLEASAAVKLRELDRREAWPTLASLLHLHALADEASAGAGLRADTEFQRRAAAALAARGSLARLPVERVRVLPKLRPPASGITLRSLSHHLAVDRSEVDVRWMVAPPSSVRVAPPPTEQLTLLLVPYPGSVRASDFRPVPGPLANMDARRYGFYEFVPQEPLDPAEILDLVEQARRHVGEVDAVVLPESALEPATAAALQKVLADAGVPYLIAGVRERPESGRAFGGNYAYFGGAGWHAHPQHKHHRWCLDASQVHQYHLGSALDPRRRWWEAIRVQPRSLTFVAVSDWLTICPLVCEDLARPDPVADVIRSVAPTLVVGLLLDGPQLASRWPARYASVLADDPGCSVLTLTSVGMARRAQPPGLAPSRVVALWKDPHRGLQQIALADDARAVALTAHPRSVRVPSADGRAGKRVPELVLSGIEQID